MAQEIISMAKALARVGIAPQSASYFRQRLIPFGLVLAPPRGVTRYRVDFAQFRQVLGAYRSRRVHPPVDPAPPKPAEPFIKDLDFARRYLREKIPVILRKVIQTPAGRRVAARALLSADPSFTEARRMIGREIQARLTVQDPEWFALDMCRACQEALDHG
jgi:hypothetical protein